MSGVPEKVLRLPPAPFYRLSRESKRLPDLPDDTLPAILSRLPATSLLRFRCVCKSWKVLIDSPGFINDQLNHSRLKPNSNLKYIITKTDDFNRNSNKRGFLYSEDVDLPTKRLWFFFSKLSHPLDSHKTEILGSCNGLLALSMGEDDIILWNPSTRRFKIIPAPAFDLQTEEYRLVPLHRFSSDPEFRIMNLGALGGCLTVVSDRYHARHHAAIWVMKEYGVEESWFPLFILSLSLYGGVCFWDYSDVVMPIAYSDCGRKVLVGLGRGVLMWYDLDRKSFDEPVVEKICGIKNDEHYEVHTCLESLVLLNDSICDCEYDIITKNEEEKKGQYLRMDFLASWFGLWFGYDDYWFLNDDDGLLNDNDLLEYIGY